jgi:tetratricopeptide (TPR) repeat protein
VNLELARLAAGKRDVPEALRYYHNALYGIWSGDRINERQRDVRAELIHFLIAEQARERAQSEILALAYHLPNDISAHLELGDMFAGVGDSQRSYSEFELVLRSEPRNELALAGAGSAAFQLRRYAEAAQLLGQLPPSASTSHEILNLATLAANNDPLDRRLVDRERSQRVISGFDQASATLNSCIAKTAGGGSPDLASLSQKFAGMRSSLTSEKLRRSPDLVFTAMELIYQGETETARVCGPLPPLDHALLLVAQKDRVAQ